MKVMNMHVADVWSLIDVTSKGEVLLRVILRLEKGEE